MKFATYGEYRLVRSNETTGSMNVAHRSELVAWHAIAHTEEGTPPNGTTACGLRYALNPDQAELPVWPDGNHPFKNCQQCVTVTGEGGMVGLGGRRYE